MRTTMYGFARVLAVGLTTIAGIAASMPLGPARADTSYACLSKPANPNDAIFKVVNSADKSERGTAFVVDARRRLLLSAAHLISGGATPEHLVLEKDGETFEFEVLAQGGNIFYLADDWVLIRAKVGTSQSSFALQAAALHLSYDPPSPTNLAGSFVLGDARTAIGASIAQARINPVPTKACQPDQTLFIEAPSYRKGHSGSPIYSPTDCGVVAISSRFALPDQVPDDERRKLLQALDQLTKDGDGTLRQTVTDTAAPLTARYDALVALMKDKNLVRIVPTKCVVDELVKGAWTGTAQDVRTLIRADASESAKPVIEGLNNLPALGDGNFWRLIDQLRPSRWSWLELLQFQDRISRARIDPDWTAKPETRFRIDGLFQRLGTIEFPEQYATLFTAYSNMQGEAVTESSLSPSGENIAVDKIAKTFVAQNASWSAATPVAFHGLKTSMSLRSALSPDQQISFGGRLAKIADGPDALPSDISPETRKWIADASIAYLSSGIASKQSDDDSGPQVQSAAIADLAQATSARGAFESPWSTKANEIKTLSSRLATAALPDLPASDIGRKAVSTRISGTSNVFKFDQGLIDFTNKTCTGPACNNLMTLGGSGALYGIDSSAIRSMEFKN